MALYVSSYKASIPATTNNFYCLELITPSTTRATIKEWWIDFNGTNPSDPAVEVTVGRVTSGTSTATAGNAVKLDMADASASVSVKHTHTAFGGGAFEPGTLVRYISTTSGFHYVAPLGQEMVLPISYRWVIQAYSYVAVSCVAGVVWSE